MNPDLYRLDQRLVFFPVRHHSPACARLVGELIHQMRPTAILIEGPADFNDQIHEMALPHQLPIAIYSYVRLANGRRRGAFYPFSIYSPEWQAIQVATAVSADVQFIDLPWEHMADETAVAHRYSDGWWERSRYIITLCEKLGVADMNDAWDTLFEIDPHLTIAEYMERAHHYCYHLRATTPEIDDETQRRETFMADRIRQMMDTTDGRLLIVTGGFHSSALFDLIHQPAKNPPISQPTSDSPTTEKGIALTPYSYKRLDGLAGYEAGMPSPGFYHHIWQDRQRQTDQPTHRRLLGMVAQMLRERGQVVSAADLIAVETTAQALAQLRGHSQIWRRDLLDGIVGALIKDEIAYGLPHPFLTAVYDLFRGSERGKLAKGTTLPPLVTQLHQLLEQYELFADHKARNIRLDLTKPDGLIRSRILHQIRVLQIPGYALTKSGGIGGDKAYWDETWKLLWSPEFESASIEASIYGPTLIDAARGKLQERLDEVEDPNADLAATILLDGALMGLPDEDDAFFQRLIALINQDGNFFTVTQALDQLLYLYRFDEVLGTARTTSVGDLLRVTFRRGLWLLESLGVVSGQDEELLTGIRALLESFERCGDLLDIAPADFIDVFTRIGQDDGQTAVVRGAVNGVLWTLGRADNDTLRRQMRYFADPQQLGDFLTGLFYLAREAIQRQPELIAQVDDFLMDYSTDEFLTALPALRLAFSFFTPREKHYMAETLFEDKGENGGVTAVVPPLQVTLQQATQILAFEERLFTEMEKYGLLT